MSFEYRQDWYRDQAVRDPVLRCYAQVRSLLRERPELRQYLKRCKHCRIFFFTEPLLWQVLGIETSGCVVALAVGQGHAPHKHLMVWSTWVEPRPAQQARVAGA